MRKTLVIITFSIVSFSVAQVSDFNTVDFTRADNIAKLNEGEDLDNLPVLAHKLTANLKTDIEKFRAIYLWVCQNIKGDTNQDSKVFKYKRKLAHDSVAYLKWNNEFKVKAFKKLFKRKKTMCTGYAYLVKELCFLADIECVIVDGYGRSVSANVEALDFANHSWNAVKLNNKWYLCDATWSSGFSINTNFIKDYNDGYFLTDPILFAKNHFPLNKKWFLNDSLANTKFTPQAIVYGETFKHKIIPTHPKTLNVTTKKDEALHFSFKTLASTSQDDIELIYFIGLKEHAFKIENFQINDNNISFSNSFKHKGNYDVHLKIDNSIVATYTVSVIN
ncbi:transglutaminase domain-containing protein [Corallibacter sp.]|uniref:transglutaminase domain-containing protein n=1 Tax=Corallibacter sp. TaxID=2038084 RepID=UPI003AB8586A